MSSNVGLSTPRGSGTSGYVQRNYAFLKPRNNNYPPPADGPGSSRPGSGFGFGDGGAFQQRQPDKQIREHDRRRAIEVKVLEERERLEEQLEQAQQQAGKTGDDKVKVLSEEEIDERCEELRRRLTREFESGKKEISSGNGRDRDADRDRERHYGRDRHTDYNKTRGSRDTRSASPPAGRERKQFKTYQVHELAEAKIEESERLRRALGIREDWERGTNTGAAAGAGGERRSERPERSARDDGDDDVRGREREDEGESRRRRRD